MNRSGILKKNLSLSFIYKILGMGLSYLSVPLFLAYLGEKDYGLWMLIYSTVSWIFLFDLGIGNGLRNQLSKCLIEKDYVGAKEYISTGYIALGIVALFLLITGILGIIFVDIGNVLSLKGYSEIFIKKLIIIVFFLTILNFILSLYKVFYMAQHKSIIGDLSNFIVQSFLIFSLIVLKKYDLISLINIAIIYPGLNVIISLFFSVRYFYINKFLIPNFEMFNKNKIKSIITTGIKFFLIQISMLIILTTDNIIIAKLLGLEEVAVYSIVSKIFQVFLLFSGLVLTPLWTLFQDAYIKKDKEWIVRTIKKLNFLFVLLCLAVFIAVLLTPMVVKIWLQKDLQFPKYLICFWGIFIINRVFGDIYMFFVNGIDKIGLQTILYVIGAILNIPLSIYFVKNLNMGSSGVILATNISMLPLSIFIPIQVYKILKKM